MSEHILPIRNYVIVYVALLALLAATVGAAYIDLGWFNFTLTMIIAVAKAAMILMIFMHVRYSDRLTWVFSTAAFLWLAILIGLTLNDYFTRDWLNIPGK
jgi:cytochrome c oxidase subunit 4